MSRGAEARRKIDPRGAGMGALLLLGFGGAAFSQAKLQTVERARTLRLAREAHRYIQTITDRARRGSILASDGRPLAADQDAYDLTVDFESCPHSPAFWLDVSDATGVSVTELQDAAATGARVRSWGGAVASSERDRLTAVCRSWRADGVSASWSGRRDYPLGSATSSLVGVTRPKGLSIGPNDERRFKRLVAREGAPKGGVFVKDLETGVEAAHDVTLTGTDGKVEGLTDRHGQFMASRGSRVVQEREDGRDVRLTIVPELQVAATAAVRRQVERTHARTGVALVMDPKTGDLLAMANWPQPTPYRADGTENDLGRGGGSNPCYMSDLEPGSMFKILTLAKCLDAAPAVARGVQNCTGAWRVTPRVTVHCDKGERHGLEDDRAAIAGSCNIAAGHWALAIGHDRFMAFLQNAGLKERSRLGLQGEAASLFPKDDGAPYLQTAIVGFGQSINCTPVQLVGAFNAIANGGVRVEPRVVAQIGGIDQPRPPERRLFSEAAAQETTAAMEAVFGHKGTGEDLRIPGYRLAGKTGTAQKKGGKQHGHVSNFIGFLPAKDPKVTILVMVDEPVGLYYGAKVAGVAWREIALEAIRHFGLAPTEPISAKPVKSKA